MGREERPQGPEGGGERGRGGEAKREGWSGRSDATLDSETEEDDWGHALLTSSSRGTQESGARGLRVVARDGRSDGQNVTSTKDNEGETRGHHGARRDQGDKKGGRRGWEGAEPWGVGGNSGGPEASGVEPDPHGVEREEGDRKASRVEENPREGPPWSGGGDQIVSGRLDLPMRGRGGRVVPGQLNPQRRGRGSRVMAG